VSKNVNEEEKIKNAWQNHQNYKSVEHSEDSVLKAYNEIVKIIS